MSEEPEISTVSAAIWPWRNRPDAAGEAAAGVAARRKAAVRESAIACAVALLLLFLFDKQVLAGIVFAIAALVLVGGLFVEPVYRGFKKLGHYLAVGVGVGMTWLLLVPFFYICFTIGRVVLVLLRKDPLNREFPTAQPTYWSAYRYLPGADSYTRQY